MILKSEEYICFRFSNEARICLSLRASSLSIEVSMSIEVSRLSSRSACLIAARKDSGTILFRMALAFSATAVCRLPASTSSLGPVIPRTANQLEDSK